MKKIYYLIKNPLLKIPIRFIDFIGYKFFNKNTPYLPIVPKRILISNIAHLGDAVIFSSIIPLIKSAFPSADLGILVGSWTESLFKNHPDVKWIHFCDHWKLNRNVMSFFNKIKQHLLFRKKTLKEIRKVNYCLAIDCYPFFPNSSYLLWKASIPLRLGYNSGGFGFLFTTALFWNQSDRFILDYQLDLLRLIFTKVSPIQKKPSLKPIHSNVYIKISNVFQLKNYLVLHTGSGNSVKEWPEEKWSMLVEKLQFAGSSLIFTGKGKRENERVKKIIFGKQNCCNLVNQLSLEEFIAVISKARLVICNNSLPVHIAWAYEVPNIVIQTGLLDPNLWTPPNPYCVSLISKNTNTNQCSN